MGSAVARRARVWLALALAGAAPAPVAGEPARCFGADTGDRIEASIYSLPARFVTAAEADRLLAAVARLAPAREIVVLTDLPLAEGARRHRVATAGEEFSPWPRDPFALARGADGRVQVVARPNLQRGREADARLAAALVAGLPPALRAAWGEPATTTAPVPFHNGQLLLDRDALWLSLHSVEPRALELLGLDRVPIASFAAPGGASRYAAAARRAADELGTLFGAPPRFVHPLPADDVGDAELMTALGGGAGFDLDSLVTLLRPAGGAPAALVGDVELGARQLPAADDPAWNVAWRLYGFVPPAGALRARLALAQGSARGRALGRFLDTVAGHLAASGFAVERLPLLLVPVALLGRGDLDHPDFVLGWNNVVVERRADGGLGAEGFASGLAPLDAEAVRRFAVAGARLALLPPLVESVVRNGGYRCASNHLRTTACAAPPAAGSPSRKR